MSQSVVSNKENKLLTEMLKIQEETNKKRNLKLAELRQSSLTKQPLVTAERSLLDVSMERPSFSKLEPFTTLPKT